MNRIETYYLIGTLLSDDFNSKRRNFFIKSIKSPTLSWPIFIITGSNHLVLQTIYCKLVQHDLTTHIPSDVLAHLKYIYHLNYQRNSEILEQVNSINFHLGLQGIIPLYLKGVGNIIDNLYGNMAERIMHDIDFLVPDQQWEIATDILLKNGYVGIKKYEPDKKMEMKHFPTLRKQGARAPVEIHRLPVDYEFSDTFGAEEVWQNKKYVNGNFNCYVMSDSHKIIHNFIHSQLHHEGHLFANVFMRNIYDLLLLSKRENPEEVFSNMSNYHKQAASYLRIMNKGFGINEKQTHVLKYTGYRYLIRHEINLRTWLISRCTYLILRIFRAYIKLPFLAITNKKLRVSLIKRLLDINWYRQHFASYNRNFIRNSNIQV